jgi:hypothetical protein
MTFKIAVGTVIAAAVLTASASASSPLILGPKTHESLALYRGYYDGHKDGYVITDTSSKSQASAWHINYSPELASVKSAPRQFFVQGKAAKGQIAVFGSEPGESDYNPLWEEIIVKWKAGVTPVMLHQDDQIDSLAKAGKLTETDAHIVLNAPITSISGRSTLGA